MGLIGALVGKYRLEAEIGRGGLGVVFRARVEGTTDSVVALKVVSHTNSDAVAAERLGAVLQQRFESSGMVPKVVEFGDDDHYFFIAMEHIQAPTLAALIHRRPLDPTDAAKHTIGLCHFLEKAHGFQTTIGDNRFEQIVHGDLKPANVFVLDNGAVKVLDFGIAKALAKTDTAKTALFVTPRYASPERLRTGRASAHDDLWAVGVMLHEMISGKSPYASIEDPPSYSRLSTAIQTNAVREPLPPTCPIPLAAIVEKLLAYQDDRRYDGAAAIRADLEAFLRHETPKAIAQFATTKTIRRPEPPVTLPVPPSVVTLPRPLPLDSRRLVEGRSPEPVEGLPATVIEAARVGPPPPPASAGFVRRLVGRNGFWVISMLTLTMAFTSEAVAWLSAERIRAELPAMELRTVAAKRQQYERQRHWGVWHLGRRLRLDRPLKRRLVTIADTVLADYRREDPTVAETQWRQAIDALQWAAQLDSRNDDIRLKILECQSHVDRIAAQTQMRSNPSEAKRLFTRAIEGFQRAAELDPESADPYLGLSRIYVYGLKNVDLAAVAIEEAQKRGHAPGWRERAQLGDGYLRRGDENRRSAMRAEEDDAQREALEAARDDYARCVEAFDAILARGRSRTHHDYCQRQLDRVTAALNPDMDESR